MRMWMVNPEFLCRKHLLGEHLECGHMLPGAINNGKIGSLVGLAKNRLIEVSKIKERHEKLVLEMQNRGYSHKSDLPEFSLDSVPDILLNITVDQNKSISDLCERCEECKKRIALKG